MKTYGKDLSLFSMGAAGYSLIEILWRGWTHWSMAATGGVCLCLLYRLFGRMREKPVLLCCLAGGMVITAVEFLVGCFVNLWMGWKVWDYSAQPGNILGQVCPLFSILWVGLSLPILFFTRALRRSGRF